MWRVHLCHLRVRWAVLVHQLAGSPWLIAPPAPLASSVTTVVWQSQLDPAAQVWQSRITVGNDVRKIGYKSVFSCTIFLYCIKLWIHLPHTVNVTVFSLTNWLLTALSTTGYFCSLGSSEPSPVSKHYGDVCPMGHFCPRGSGSPRPCPVGSFLPEPGASTPSHCHSCPPGKYCLTPGGLQPTG